MILCRFQPLPLLLAVTLAGCGGSSSTDTPFVATSSSGGHGLGARLASPEELDRMAEGLDPEDLVEDDGTSLRAARPALSMLSEAALPAVADQGQLMSCAAFAMAYNLQSHVSGQGQRDLRTPANQVSPAVAYRVALSQGNQSAQQAQAAGGTSCPHYLDTAVYYGGTSNATVGYPNMLELTEAAQVAFIDGLDLQSVVPDPRFGIGSWTSLDPRHLDLLKDYLADGQMVAFGARVQENLGTFQGSGVYQAEGRVLGGHAMVITGYDDGRQAFRIRNSWGPRWADGGSVWMGYPTFTSTVTEAYVARPVLDETIQPTGGAFTVDFVGGQFGPSPAGGITRVHQEPAAGGGVVLVLFYRFDQGVELTGVTLQSPSGKKLRHSSLSSTRNGYYYFKRQDGNQWLAGRYPVELDIRTPGGNLYVCRTTIRLDAAEGSVLPAADFPAQVTGLDGRPAESL